MFDNLALVEITENSNRNKYCLIKHHQLPWKKDFPQKNVDCQTLENVEFQSPWQAIGVLRRWQKAQSALRVSEEHLLMKQLSKCKALSIF